MIAIIGGLAYRFKARDKRRLRQLDSEDASVEENRVMEATLPLEEDDEDNAVAVSQHQDAAAGRVLPAADADDGGNLRIFRADDEDMMEPIEAVEMVRADTVSQHQDDAACSTAYLPSLPGTAW